MPLLIFYTIVSRQNISKSPQSCPNCFPLALLQEVEMTSLFQLTGCWCLESFIRAPLNPNAKEPQRETFVVEETVSRKKRMFGARHRKVLFDGKDNWECCCFFYTRNLSNSDVCFGTLCSFSLNMVCTVMYRYY
ncbi:hypothetical protein CEXT_97751 [Caerostris extrusa]|uniref:Uncharacterized protein n=1 Tax=Caerostris extrusa TaxID=172846 RepID=A0AAV4XSR9_CAEEX|nr:hypothetical protein CEXT_97751 [Caerostris extrusa]